MSRTATGPRPVFVQLRIPGNDIMAHQTGGKRWPRTARIGLPARALGVLLQGAVRQAGGAPATALAAGAVVAAAFITAAWRRRDDDRASLTYLIAATLLLTPICWIFYLTLLLIPLCLYRPRLSAVATSPTAPSLSQPRRRAPGGTRLRRPSSWLPVSGSRPRTAT